MNSVPRWNTSSDGTGTTYTQAQTFLMSAASVTLFARWTANTTYTVTYYGNGNTVGSVPIDTTNYEQGQTATALGNTNYLAKAGYAFASWNTQTDGSGATYAPAQTFTMGAADVSLYARWTAVYPRFAYVANLLDNNISQYTIGTDGALSPMAAATVAALIGGLGAFCGTRNGLTGRSPGDDKLTVETRYRSWPT